MSFSDLTLFRRKFCEFYARQYSLSSQRASGRYNCFFLLNFSQILIMINTSIILYELQKRICHKFGSSAGASNATELSASGGLHPLTPHRGLCPLDPRWGLRPQSPGIGSRSRARHGRGSSPSNVIYWPRPWKL